MHEKTVLKNGVRIVHEHMQHVRTVSVGIWVGVGSRFEKRSQNGAAHFIEHMLFKGTQSRTAAELAAEMDSIGGQINAFTTREATCFYARVLDTHVDSAIELLSDMLFNSKFDTVDVDNERGVICEEIDMYDDTPDDMVAERMISRSFPTALGRPILGTKSILKKLDSEALRGFMDEHYTPGRIVVALSGNFSQAHLSHIEDLFSPLKKARLKKPKSAEYMPSFTLKRKSTEQNHLCLGFPGISATDDSRFALQILSTVFGGGMSSRLFQTVREQNGLCYSIYNFNSSFSETGMFAIATALGRDTEQRAVELIMSELEKLRNDGITADELGRAREQAKAGILMALESTSSRMNRIGFGELYLGGSLSTDEVIERYDHVTLDDIKDLAQKLLDPGAMSFSAVGKVSAEDTYRKILGM